jgi:cytochrome c oxidase subunit 2
MNELLRRMLFLPPQASTLAPSVDHLHFVVIGTTFLGAFVVFALTVLFAVRDRRRPGHRVAAPERMPGKLEALLIAATLGLFLAWWAVGFRQYLAMRQPPPDALTVYVTARQWMWKFTWPEGAGAINVLTVPQGRAVRLVMTSRDVIHSVFIPAFRLKQDVLPGRYVTAWFEATRPGTYDLFCTEYCGLSHSGMRAVVRVLPPAEYASWLARTAHHADVGGVGPSDDGELAARGRRVAERASCFACHTTDGQPATGPTWRNAYGRTVTLADGRTLRADEAYLTRSMMDPTDDLVAGFNPVMPTYRGLLDAADVAALVEYIKSLRGPGFPVVQLPTTGAAWTR